MSRCVDYIQLRNSHDKVIAESCGRNAGTLNRLIHDSKSKRFKGILLVVTLVNSLNCAGNYGKVGCTCELRHRFTQSSGF